LICVLGGSHGAKIVKDLSFLRTGCSSGAKICVLTRGFQVVVKMMIEVHVTLKSIQRH